MPSHCPLIIILCWTLGGCLSITPREAGGVLGDTLLRVCVFTEKVCNIEVIAQPGSQIIMKKKVTKSSVLRKLNPPINFSKELQVFANCGDGNRLLASARMPDPFDRNMCLLVQPY